MSFGSFEEAIEIVERKLNAAREAGNEGGIEALANLLTVLKDELAHQIAQFESWAEENIPTHGGDSPIPFEADDPRTGFAEVESD